MEPTLDAFFHVLSGLHESAKRTLAGLSPEQLDWRPGDDMNSLAVLVAHTALHLGHMQITRQLLPDGGK